MVKEAMGYTQTTPRYIAIEGPIGVGKTSLSKRLAYSFNYELLLEKSEQNPFLERFYKEPKRHALSTQLFFFISTRPTNSGAATRRYVSACSNCRFPD